MQPEKLGRRRISPNTRHEELLAEFTQPLTTAQLAFRTRMKTNRCNDIVRTMAAQGLISCLNPLARRSRVYWLTARGLKRREPLAPRPLDRTFPADIEEIDWDLYGWLCYSHRSAVLKALEKPLNAASVKRAARFRDPEIRMSANNARDVLRLFLRKGVTTRANSPLCRPVYELTDQGETFQTLLLRAETRTLHDEPSRLPTNT